MRRRCDGATVWELGMTDGKGSGVEREAIGVDVDDDVDVLID